MHDRYPDVKITDLIIGDPDRTGTTQCNACTDSNPETDCDPEENFYGYDIQNNTETPVPVTSMSPSIWFKAGECGSAMKTTATEAIFQTEILKPPTIDNATQIISQRTILATNITCKYPNEIAGMVVDPGANIQIDGSTDSEK